MVRMRALCLAGVLCAGFATVAPAQEQPLPEIPGLTAPDPAPRACVDCHVDRPEAGMDVRLSTQIRQWSEQVPEKVHARVRPLVPNAAELSGRHPPLPAESYEDVPASCTSCHNGERPSVPALAPMLHVLHLTDEADNHFLTLFEGACTLCHKLDAETGRWSVPSAPERKKGGRG